MGVVRAGRLSVVRALLVTLLLCGISCRRDAPATVETDLVALFPFTSSASDTSEIDFGTAQADPYLGRGWSDRQLSPAGETVTRAVARKASVDLTLVEPTERELTVRCAATRVPERRPASVIVQLNGRRIGSFEAGPTMADYVVRLPAGMQRGGRNELSFNARLGRGNGRMEVAYDRLRIRRLSDTQRAAPRAEGDALVLPAPSAVDYFLRMPAEPVLRIGTEDGSAQAHLTVRIQREGEAERTIFSTADSGAPAEIALSAYGGQIARLGFDVAGGGSMRVAPVRLRGTHKAAPARPPAGTARNVILYVIDTLRADHLGCYGYARSTSPEIDAFAQGAVLFSHVTSQSSWTRPAVASILTGRYPPVHGASTLRRGIRSEVPTLAELLQAKGIRTAAFVTNVNVAPQWGFGRGFATYEYLPEDARSEAVHVGADVLNARGIEWLTSHAQEPFFLYLHASDPHAPYKPPAPWSARFASSTAVAAERIDTLLAEAKKGLQPSAEEVAALVDRYDGEIAFTDSNFAALLAALRRLDLDDDTLIVLVGDHGEEFADHGGFEHGDTLYGEQLRVPLIVRFPDGASAGRRVSATARQIDIVPTVLEALGLPMPTDLPGRPLQSIAQGGEVEPVDALADTQLGRRALSAVITDNWKVIQSSSLGSARIESYDLSSDPGERDDRASQTPLLVGYARQTLAARGADAPVQQRSAVNRADPALMERLRALGYTE